MIICLSIRIPHHYGWIEKALLNLYNNKNIYDVYFVENDLLSVDNYKQI